MKRKHDVSVAVSASMIFNIINLLYLSSYNYYNTEDIMYIKLLIFNHTRKYFILSFLC